MAKWTNQTNKIQWYNAYYRLKAEKATAPHSSTLAWQIPWMEEPGRLQSMGSLGVGHNWVTSLSLFTFMHWRRKWQPTPVFLPGESQGRGSLGGLPSLGSHRVGHDWSDLAAAAAVRYNWKVLIMARKRKLPYENFTQKSFDLCSDYVTDTCD